MHPHNPRTPDPRLPYALDYAARGWPVFVLGRSKRPLANCPTCSTAGPTHDRNACGCLTCHGFYAATLVPDRVAAMLAAHPRGLLAIRTGAISGLVVIDIDPRHGGRLDPDLMTRTMAVFTAGGGWHLYYRHPGGRIPSRPLPSVSGVDVKADGGYVVAPPTVLPGRGAYRHVTGGPLRLGEMAPALEALCRTDTTASPSAHPRPQPRPDRPHTPTGGGAISSPTALLASILQAVHDAPKGRHRVTLYGAARGTARMVDAGALTPTQAWEALWTTGKTNGQTDRETREAILGGFRAEGITTPTPERWTA